MCTFTLKMDRKVCEIVAEVQIKEDEEEREQCMINYFATNVPIPIGQRVCSPTAAVAVLLKL